MEILDVPLCYRPESGEKYGWGKVFDYIGIPWEDEVFDMENNQINFFDSEV